MKLRLSKWIATALILLFILFVLRSNTSPTNHNYNDRFSAPLTKRTATHSKASMLHDYVPPQSFVQAIAARASEDRYIILSMVDTAFVDMAVNLYESSFRPNGITNFLFVGVGQKTCDLLNEASMLISSPPLPCHHYLNDSHSDKASVYRSPEFLRKMNVRTDMILEALAAGFTVVHTDLDVFFASNPLPDLKMVMMKADVSALWDSLVYNAGFLVVRPTRYGKRMYEVTKRITTASKSTDDQQALNQAIRRMSKLKLSPSESSGDSSTFKIKKLNTAKYVCGVNYFEPESKYFPRIVPNVSVNPHHIDPIVIHNNWIVSYAAKVYRFKEHMMWMYDKDGYYSSNTRRYLVYDNPLRQTWMAKKNPVAVGKMIVADQINALRAALIIGKLLQRVVILPRFHCISRSSSRSSKGIRRFFNCPLNSIIKLSSFDSAFSGVYRESSFLHHPKVPATLASDISVRHELIVDDVVKGEAPASVNSSKSSISSPTRESLPSNPVPGSYILQWVGGIGERILNLGSLYDVQPQLISDDRQREFDKLAVDAFTRKAYRQH